MFITTSIHIQVVISEFPVLATLASMAAGKHSMLAPTHIIGKAHCTRLMLVQVAMHPGVALATTSGGNSQPALLVTAEMYLQELQALLLDGQPQLWLRQEQRFEICNLKFEGLATFNRRCASPALAEMYLPEIQALLLDGQLEAAAFVEAGLLAVLISLDSSNNMQC